MLSDAGASNKDTMGTGFLDGFSANFRQIADLSRGTGPSQGHVIFPEGPDQLVIKILGNVTTAMNDRPPNTTFKGNWRAVKGYWDARRQRREGKSFGHFTAEDKFHVDWEGTCVFTGNALANSNKN